MPEYKTETIKLAPDKEGENIATLISAKSKSKGTEAVLYFHGFIDYFFQDHLAEWFLERGHDFYALEIRKYGRSLLPHQKPNFIHDIKQYYEEIDRSIEIMLARDGNEKVLLLGHSTGGLIVASYANWGKYRDKISRIVLNSPFLELNVPSAMRIMFMPLLNKMGKPLPYMRMPFGLSKLYPMTLHKSYFGEWDFDLKYKPIEGFPVYLGWMGAVYREQRAIQKKSAINVPVLLLHSDRSSVHFINHPEIFETDIVLNVDHMRKHGPRLGKNVEMAEIPKALHDVFLSKKEVRERAFERMGEWLEKTG